MALSLNLQGQVHKNGLVCGEIGIVLPGSWGIGEKSAGVLVNPRWFEIQRR